MCILLQVHIRDLPELGNGQYVGNGVIGGSEGDEVGCVGDAVEIGKAAVAGGKALQIRQFVAQNSVKSGRKNKASSSSWANLQFIRAPMFGGILHLLFTNNLHRGAATRGRCFVFKFLHLPHRGVQLHNKWKDAET